MHKAKRLPSATAANDGFGMNIRSLEGDCEGTVRPRRQRGKRERQTETKLADNVRPLPPYRYRKKVDSVSEGAG